MFVTRFNKHIILHRLSQNFVLSYSDSLNTDLNITSLFVQIYRIISEVHIFQVFNFCTGGKFCIPH